MVAEVVRDYNGTTKNTIVVPRSIVPHLINCLQTILATPNSLKYLKVLEINLFLYIIILDHDKRKNIESQHFTPRYSLWDMTIIQFAKYNLPQKDRNLAKPSNEVHCHPL